MTRAAESWWRASLPVAEHRVATAPLEGEHEADVVIVGAGYSGLWTAFHLAERDPGLRVVVLEARDVGFGASGRNGGWMSAMLPMGLDAMADRWGRAAAVRMRRAMIDAVHDVAALLEREGIDCDLALDGTVTLARSEPQRERLRAAVEHQRSYGFGPDDIRWLTADEAASTVPASSVLGGVFDPHCAAVHPLRLVLGLARAVEARGVTIHEHTRVTSIEPGCATAEHGSVRARYVLRCTEGFTERLVDGGRGVVPVYSMMIATEPLPEQLLRAFGGRRPTFTDDRRMIVYGQPTADGRLAFGGRGAFYHLGSRTSPAHDTNTRVRRHLVTAVAEMFPELDGVGVVAHWGGPIGAARDWMASVGLDRENGMGWAGGYVGDGVTTTYLAGRTLADLVVGEPSPLTTLGWVGHRSPRWEPEPVRWLGVNAATVLPRLADRYEAVTGRRERVVSRVLDLLTGGGH